MPAERVKMRHAREIFRLKFSGVATRDIARRLGFAPSTVREMLKRGEAAGIAWPLPRGDGRYARLLKSLGRTELLILDDFGLEPLDANARHDLLEILEERYGRRSTIVTSQLPIPSWHAVIGDPTYADAILDRLIHNAHRIELTGESLRRTKTKQPKSA